MVTPESMMLPALIAEARALAERAAETGARTILGITGAPGAGKSTLAAAIVDALGPDLAALVPMDGFHLAGSVLAAHGSSARKGAIDTFDDAGFAALLERLRARDPGEVVFAPRFDREIEEPVGSALPIRPEVPLLVTEGNYLLAAGGRWPRARAALDAVWFLELEQEERQRRLIARHERFGRTPEQARAHALGSDEANARAIALRRARADRIVTLAN
ncbi:nucleoside/nucleotide kinase family protein [Brachybacterium sp. JHP9]|uniref:Nucleoside/nucleotide kinase family protein n=1 Tax=Brachybacterium equifaecis TaxID=2910770 RepID=A0ABT0QZR7_9MICO|nr:nucleoside/nucleotide kinase family protein [Brachybacterium equifaecis]MCL6422539.1 nucleoside/nucleotide kinase family protein [Brachybacterium equifaecis]